MAQHLGIKRTHASAPTLDAERSTPFTVGRGWDPATIKIFDHTISIDLLTGNLAVSIEDLSYPYHNFGVGIRRIYDSQEQHMQLSCLREHPNIDPRPHWFGNWQFGYEADVNEVWHNTLFKLQVSTGNGVTGLFGEEYPDFCERIKSSCQARNLLRTYGIPGSTISEIGWNFKENDFILRTMRGPFQILCGRFYPESIVDPVEATLWLFNPINGTALRISSDYQYVLLEGWGREIGPRLLVDQIIDALGHKISLRPSAFPIPHREFFLSDSSGTTIQMLLNQQLRFLDGKTPDGEVREYIVSTIIDCTKSRCNQFQYGYSSENLLRTVMFPSSIGQNQIAYHYEDAEHPGILTSIENYLGDRITFEYIEDALDNDERLRPRLKIARIVDPEGIALEYTYNYSHSEASVRISQNGNIDRMIRYRYIRDGENNNERFLVAVETEVKRGYWIGASGNVEKRLDTYPQLIKHKLEYTADGKYNVKREIDPLNRFVEYEYNQFNQVTRFWDLDKRLTRNTYDIPALPSISNPICYDLRCVEQENLLRDVNPANPGSFNEAVSILKRELKYAKYNQDNSIDTLDHDSQSTHRVKSEIDVRGNLWAGYYDDLNHFCPLSPSSVRSPMNNITQCSYNERGQLTELIDPGSLKHSYKYSSQGTVQEYEDPNTNKITLTYYDCGGWLYKFVDQTDNAWEIVRDASGQIMSMIDPVLDKVDYKYYKNGRLKQIIHHRPAVYQVLDETGSQITGFPDLITEFEYTPLGQLSRLKNPKGLYINIEYDEAGRLVCWYLDLPDHRSTVSIFDEADQLLCSVDQQGKRTTYTYDHIGRVNRICYPAWSDGINSISGTVIDFVKYDFFGRVLSLNDSDFPHGSFEHIYDAAGNLLARKDADGFVAHFHYDDDNRLYAANDGSGDCILAIDLDGLGRPKTVRDSDNWDGGIDIRYTYERHLEDHKQVWGLFEKRIPKISLVSEFDYNEKNQLKSLLHRWESSHHQIFSQELGYRQDGLVGKILGDGANCFRYDGEKQLIYEQLVSHSSDYDEAGNCLYRADKSVETCHPGSLYNEQNQLIKTPSGEILSYDNNGNLSVSTTGEKTTEYHFDSANRLRVVRDSKKEVRYLYDHKGNLCSRIETDLSKHLSTTTTFHYLLSKPSLVKLDGQPELLLTWDPNGKLIRIRKAQPLGDMDLDHSVFPIYDGLGNIVRVVDNEQKERARISYDAFGGVISIEDPEQLMPYWGFKAGFKDKYTGNILFGARWYAPNLGRWISQDPRLTRDAALGDNEAIAYRDYNNLYAYVWNNPLQFIDPSGLSPSESIWDLGTSVGGRLLDISSLAVSGIPTLGMAGLAAGGLLFGVLGFASLGGTGTDQIIGFLGNLGNLGFNVASVVAAGGVISAGTLLSVASIGLGTFSLTLTLLHETPLGETYLGSGQFGADLADLIIQEDDPPGYRQILQWYEDERARSRSTFCAGSKCSPAYNIPNHMLEHFARSHK